MKLLYSRHPRDEDLCEGVRVVIGDEAPLGGVAQVLHGVPVIEVSLQVREREEGEKGKGRGSAGGSKRRGRRESRRNAHHGWHGDDGERLKDDLSQCGVTRDEDRKHYGRCAAVLTCAGCARCDCSCHSCWCRWCHCCPHWS